jgi:hypothetical protein
VASNSLMIEGTPASRPHANALVICGLANSYVFDWLLRLAVSSNIRYTFLDQQPVPSLEPYRPFIAHGVLRLVCNHEGYAALWRDQVGDAWRESRRHPGWPVLSDEVERWSVRAALDALLAHAYSLDRELYQYVLSAFDHSAQPYAPRMCLDKFDELASIGWKAFTENHDPYWEIPLNQALPTPVIAFPGLPESGGEAEFSLKTPSTPSARGPQGRNRMR